MSRDLLTNKQTPLQDNSQKLMELISKHGMKAVPDEELEAIGYMRTAEGRITEKKYVEERLAKKEADFQVRMEQRPFDEINLHFKGHDTSFLRMSGEMTERVFDAFEDLEDDEEAVKIWREKSPESRNIDCLTNDLAAYYEKKGFSPSEASDFSDELIKRNEEWLFNKLVRAMGTENIDQRLQSYLTAIGEEGDDQEGVYVDDKICALTGKGSQELYVLLERSRAIMQDKDIIWQDFEEALSGLIKDDMMIIYEDLIADGASKPFEKILVENADKKAKEYLFEVFRDYFGEKGWQQVAACFDPNSQLQAVSARLGALKNSDIPGHDLIAKAKKQMAALPPEEKKSFSQGFAQLQAERDQQLKIFMGVKDFMGAPERISRYLGGVIKDVMEACRRKSAGDEDVAFYLDGRPNEDLDRDPGAVSGDCTAGKPLPFEVPEAKLSNVKVYDDERRHIGNVYLLETEADDEKAWHLEAIQIPSTVDWSESFGIFVEELAKTARSQGVKIITVNEDPLHISNYDVIRNAVLDYHEQNGSSRSFINYPEIASEKYSRFQGNGPARILWQDGE